MAASRISHRPSRPRGTPSFRSLLAHSQATESGPARYSNSSPISILMVQEGKFRIVSTSVSCVELTRVTSGFDRPGTTPRLIDVNYGNLPLDPLIQPRIAPQTWQAVVHGDDKLPDSWRWSTTNRVTFICHSQGGTTVRYLLYLLSGAAPLDLPQFPSNDEQARAKAVITLGTPHKGTTVTDVVLVST